MLNSIPENLDQCTFDFDALNAQPYEPAKLYIVEMPRRKRCSRCKKIKDIDQFPKTYTSGIGYASWCKNCTNEHARERQHTRRQEIDQGLYSPPTDDRECTLCHRVLPADKFGLEYRNKDRLKPWCKDCSAHRHRLAKYGLTPDQYGEMFEAQGGVCAICHKPETRLCSTGEVSPLVIDHNHYTGEVRALLCHDCNLSYGLLKEDHSRILALLAYHQKWNSE